MLRQLLKHTSNYTLGNVLMVLAGLVSFPLLTRVLSVDEYGLMSLVATALTLAVGLGKLGLQNAALRFYSEVQSGKREVGHRAYLSTVMLGMGAAGVTATALWAAISQCIPQSWWSDPRIKPLMLWTSVLIAVRVFDSALISQLRAQERSGVLMIYSVLRRYAGLGLMLGILFFVAGNVWGFYAATIASELLATMAMAVWMLRKEPPRLSLVSAPLLRSMIAFGFPLVAYELAAVVLVMGDRYIIEHLMGAGPLGIFSAVYNLCDYIKQMLLGSLVLAAQPMCLRLWEQKGADDTRAFVKKFMGIYVMVAMFVVAGMAAIAGELLALLASEKYRVGAPVIGYVMAGMALEAVVIITSLGLYLEKRSKTSVALLLCCAVLNLGLNFVLIPHLGLIGPAVATLISCALLVLAGAWLGQRTLPLPIPWWAVAKFAAIASAMYFSVIHIELGGDVQTILARMLVGSILYAGLTLALDREARQGLNLLRTKFGLAS